MNVVLKTPLNEFCYKLKRKAECIPNHQFNSQWAAEFPFTVALMVNPCTWCIPVIKNKHKLWLKKDTLLHSSSSCHNILEHTQPKLRYKKKGESILNGK
jgi:hypothetical protein